MMVKEPQEGKTILHEWEQVDIIGCVRRDVAKVVALGSHLGRRMWTNGKISSYINMGTPRGKASSTKEYHAREKFHG